MPILADVGPPSLLLLAVLLAILVCLALWVVVPYQPRRPVPWRSLDLGLVMLFYVTAQGAAIGMASLLLGKAPPAPAVVGGPKNEHVITQLMAQGDAWMLLVCFVSAVVVAPLAEEFFFRVLLQGWLEAMQHRWRRHLPTLRRLIPAGALPVAFTSLLFARLHFRVDMPEMSPRFLTILLAGDAVARVLAMVFAVVMMRWRVGATAVDFGWSGEKLGRDVRLGLAAFVAMAAPVYATQLAFHKILPESIAPDPFPLLLLALALGTLYYRTHRIMPLVVLHASVNGASLLLAWLGR